jgi:cell division protein FtsL
VSVVRVLNFLVIAVLVMAAAYVYEIKFESTLQAERLAKLRAEIRRERDAVAALRAEWAKLDTPGRIQGLAQRHLPLKPVKPAQISNFDELPMRPPAAGSDQSDPIGAMIGIIEETDIPTSGVGQSGH